MKWEVGCWKWREKRTLAQISRDVGRASPRLVPKLVSWASTQLLAALADMGKPVVRVVGHALIATVDGFPAEDDIVRAAIRTNRRTRSHDRP